ncbi:NAD(P)H-binding protein [Streptomyces phaeochromogenes]|uniref:SDR family oxidoreductase n=1 Tax=Streptomyces phaeochromogenes TaxID=1923 RepID=UPI002E2B1346|nr:NmrA family NAD(P)-binding protein [Streptomyces phaeochromogenes]
MSIVITGAAGAAGRSLIAALRSRDVEVVALSHSDAGEQCLRDTGATVVRADLAHPAQLREPFAGAQAVHVIPPSLHPLEDVLVGNAVRAAVAAGVPRLVYHSVMHPHAPVLRNHLRKANAEAVVRDSGLRWTILQPSMFSQVALLMFGGDADGEVALPFNPESRISMLDLRDLAEVAALVLTEPGHDYATYELAGPLTSLKEMAVDISAVRGKPLTTHQVPVADGPLPSVAAANPMAAADMISTFAHYDQHGYLGNPRVLEMLLGRPATTFAEVAARELG